MTGPVSDDMHIAQLQGHLKHCENEVNKAKNALDEAELRWREAWQALTTALIAALERSGG